MARHCRTDCSTVDKYKANHIKHENEDHENTLGQSGKRLNEMALG